MSDRKPPYDASGTVTLASDTTNPLTESSNGSPPSQSRSMRPNSPRIDTFPVSGIDTLLSDMRSHSSSDPPNRADPTVSPQISLRAPLFEEPPDASIPGNVHLISDTSLARLIETNGAINLLRQMAKDLAERDSQITEMRKRFEDREKRLKHMLFESGVSRSDVERRLASISLQRRPSRDSIVSIKPRSEFSYIETLDDQLQDAMSEADECNSPNGDANADSTQFETPKPNGPKRSSRTEATSDNSRSPHLSIRNGSPGDRRRRSALSKWSAGLFGWDTRRLNGPPRGTTGNQRLSKSAVEALSSNRPRVSSSASSLRGSLIMDEQENVGLEGDSSKLLAKDKALAERTALWPADRGEPLHFKAIVLAEHTKPPDLDAPTSEGWLVYRRASSTVAGLAYSLVFDRTKTPSKEEGDQVEPRSEPKYNRAAPNRGSRRIDDIHSRMRSISVPKGHEPWYTPVLRDTAQSVLPTSSHSKQGPRQSTMELETFIPDADQPPTMLPAWNDYNNDEQGIVLTDRFGFKLFDARSKRREVTEQIFETMNLDDDERPASNSCAPSPLIPSSSQDELDDSRPSLASPPTSIQISADSTSTRSHHETQTDHDTLSISASTSTKNIQTFNTCAVSPRPLTPETTLNKSGAVFSNEKSSARLLMLSQLDLYGADKAKQENWDSFLRKTREDRRKVGNTKEDWVDQNEDELIGLAGLGTGKMAKERRKELNHLIVGGIPMAYRPKIWGEMTGAYMLKEPLYYQDLLSHGRDIDFVCVSQIDLDIKRTMPSNVFFAGTGPGVPKLRRVLLAFSRHNTDVGYCQGMNVIAATLLLTHPTEEDAFFVLACIVEKILPLRYFTPDLLTSRADQTVLKHFVKEIRPKIHNHLQSLGIDLEAITFGWFLSVFTDCLPAEHLFRTWDVFFIEGHQYLFCVAIALLVIHETALLTCDSPGEVYTLLKELKKARDMNIDEFVKMTEQIKTTIRNKGFDITKLQASAVKKLIPHEHV